MIAHRQEVLLEDVDLFKDHLVISERREGLTHLRIRRLSTGVEHEIQFHDPAYVAYSGTNPEWDTHRFRYGYTSLTTPSSVYEHDLNTLTDTLLKQQEVIGMFNAGNYVSERMWVTARDGAKVPVSIVITETHCAQWNITDACSMATVVMVSTSNRRSAARGYHYWTVALCSPSRTSVAARNWVVIGTTTGRWSIR